MGDLANISGASFPASGAASAGSTGFSVITGGTHVGSTTDLPPGSGASGYIRSPDNGALNLRIDATSVPMQTNETDYWITCWWRFARTSAALPADQTNVQFQAWSNSGAKLINYMYIRNLAHIQGIGVQPALFTSSGTFAEKMHDTGSSGSSAVIPFDRWVFVCVHVRRSSTVGVLEFYVNGVLIQRCRDINTDTEVTAAQLQATTNMNWWAISGIRAEVCGPFRTYDTTGPVLRPMHSLTPATSDAAQVHGVDVADDVSNSNGKCWTYAGTATRAVTSYAVGGVSPNRKRWIYTGAGVTWAQTLIDQIGALPFNARGWATLALPVVQIRDGTGQLVVRNSGGTAILTLDVISAQLRLGATVLAPWVMADRYCLLVHFSSTGSIKGSLFNLTKNNSAVNAWSFDLGTWTAGAVGTVTVSGANATLAHECEGLWVMRWVPLAGVDSLSQSDANGLAPALATVNNIAAALSPTTDSNLIPDAAYTNRVWGLTFSPIVAVIGRAGATRRVLQQNVLDQLTHARGLDLINFDGGSVNEITSVSSAATQTSVLATLRADVESMCDQALARDCRVWLTTMPRRPYGGVWSPLQIETTDLFSIIIRSIASAKQSTNLHIRLSDTAARIADHSSLFSMPADSTHMNLAGSAEVAKQMVLGLTIPAVVPIPRSFVGVLLNGVFVPVSLTTTEQAISILTPAIERGSQPQVAVWAASAWLYDTAPGQADALRISVAANQIIVLKLDSDAFVFYVKTATGTATLQLMRTG